MLCTELRIQKTVRRRSKHCNMWTVCFDLEKQNYLLTYLLKVKHCLRTRGAENYTQHGRYAVGLTLRPHRHYAEPPEL